MEYRLIKTLKQITGIALLVDQSIFNLRIIHFFIILNYYLVDYKLYSNNYYYYLVV